MLAMAINDDFNDRQTQIDAENTPYNDFTYQEDNNSSWAGALPVKQYVLFHLPSKHDDTNSVRGLYDPDLEKDACGVGFTW